MESAQHEAFEEAESVERQQQIDAVIEQYRRACTTHYPPREEIMREYLLTHPNVPFTQLELGRVGVVANTAGSAAAIASTFLGRFRYQDPARPGMVTVSEGERPRRYRWDPLAIRIEDDQIRPPATPKPVAARIPKPPVRRPARPQIVNPRKRPVIVESGEMERFSQPLVSRVERDAARGALVLASWNLAIREEEDWRTLHTPEGIVTDDDLAVELVTAVAEAPDGLTISQLREYAGEHTAETVGLKTVIDGLRLISDSFTLRGITGWSFGWAQDQNGSQRQIARFDSRI